MCTDFIYFPFFYKILTSDDFYIRHFNLGLKPKISTESQPNLQIGTKLLSCRRISKMRGGVKIMLGRLSLVLAPADVATVSSCGRRSVCGRRPCRCCVSRGRGRSRGTCRVGLPVHIDQVSSGSVDYVIKKTKNPSGNISVYPVLVLRVFLPAELGQHGDESCEVAEGGNRCEPELHHQPVDL